VQKEKSESDGSELNRKFYHELLYILGLKEYEKNGVFLINRLPKAEREPGSFIENAGSVMRTALKRLDKKNILDFRRGVETLVRF
jgi:hypothetical protein